MVHSHVRSHHARQAAPLLAACVLALTFGLIDTAGVRAWTPAHMGAANRTIDGLPACSPPVPTNANTYTPSALQVFFWTNANPPKAVLGWTADNSVMCYQAWRQSNSTKQWEMVGQQYGTFTQWGGQPLGATDYNAQAGAYRYSVCAGPSAGCSAPMDPTSTSEPPRPLAVFFPVVNGPVTVIQWIHTDPVVTKYTLWHFSDSVRMFDVVGSPIDVTGKPVPQAMLARDPSPEDSYVLCAFPVGCSDPVKAITASAPTFQSRPILQVSTAQPHEGEKFQLFGSGFLLPPYGPPPDSVSIYLDHQSPDALLATATPDATGAFQVTVSLSANTVSGTGTGSLQASPGPHTLLAVMPPPGSQALAVADSALPQAKITLQAASQAAGQTLAPALLVLGAAGGSGQAPVLSLQVPYTVTGTNFAADQPVEIYLDTASGTPLTTVSAADVKQDGSFQTSVTINFTPAGSHQLVAQQTAGGKTLTASLTITVPQGP